MKCCSICPYESSCTINPKSCNKTFAVFDLEKLPEHDARIRAEVIDEVINLIYESYEDSGTPEYFEAWKNRLEQMKGEWKNEQNNQT